MFQVSSTLFWNLRNDLEVILDPLETIQRFSEKWIFDPSFEGWSKNEKSPFFRIFFQNQSEKLRRMVSKTSKISKVY